MRRFLRSAIAAVGLGSVAPFALGQYESPYPMTPPVRPLLDDEPPASGITKAIVIPLPEPAPTPPPMVAPAAVPAPVAAPAVVQAAAAQPGSVQPVSPGKPAPPETVQEGRPAS